MSRATSLLALLLVAHVLLVGWAATRHSPCIDEVGHLAAGLNHWETGHFDLYRVNPPLVRMTATLPLWLGGVTAPLPLENTAPPARPEFNLGRAFVTEHGERSFGYFTVARWACLPFSLLGAYICYRWAKDLYGSWSGLLAAALWCFCPNVLAHAQMITPDTGASALGVAACYLFWRWLRAPDWRSAWNAGFVLGLAELCKTTWILLFVLWPILWIVWRLAPHPSSSRSNWRREGWQILAILVFSVSVINAGYAYEDSFQPLKRFPFVSKALTEDEGAGQRKNRFADSRLGDVPVPLPRNYLLGIDVQKQDFENGYWSYLRGEWRQGGWWYYYLYGLAIKMPLGTLLLVLLALGRLAIGRQDGPGWRDEITLLAPALMLVTLVSGQTGFNHHLRYVLPAFPFLFVWISRAALPLERGKKVWEGVVLGALAWSIVGSLVIYPHSMSYFNEFVGGSLHGSEHLVDSNIDWGQDLLYLKSWLDEHPEAKPLGLAYFGYIDPDVAGISLTLPPKGPTSASDSEGPRAKNLGPRPGWYAVSVSLLRGYRYPIANGRGGIEYLDEPYYTYFQRFMPVTHAGYSIFIYHLDVEECTRVRIELGLSPLGSEIQP